MAGRGLQSSAWAPKYAQDLGSSRRVGDWRCPSCGSLNFPHRSACFGCSHPGPSTVARDTTARRVESILQNVMWQPELTEPSVANGRHDTNAPNAPEPQLISRPIVPYLASAKVYNAEDGLATSRWAPRNYIGRSGPVRMRQSHPTPLQPPITPSPSSAPISPPNPNTQECSLPYEVQHYILATIQRMLEEACYDFAARWIPSTLYTHNWTCAESVELSTWRKVLPSTISPTAIAPLPNYDLETGLADAVRIRNAAVHRHLCTDCEMRQHAEQAGSLMAMLGDGTRREKFLRLSEELEIWSAGSKMDPEGAKERLSQALREIGERPVDDMDWSPNAASAHEILNGEEEVREGEGVYIDSMEVD